MAIARADADIYALIATKLSQEKGKSVGWYVSAAQEEFKALAPWFLKHIQELYTPLPNGYQLTQFDDNGYIFTTNGGYTFAVRNETLDLCYKGIKWLSEGNVLGEKYTLMT